MLKESFMPNGYKTLKDVKNVNKIVSIYWKSDRFFW